MGVGPRQRHRHRAEPHSKDRRLLLSDPTRFDCVTTTKLKKYGARPHPAWKSPGVKVGGEPGFAMKFDIEPADRQQRVSFWTTEDAGTRRGAFLSIRTPRYELSAELNRRPRESLCVGRVLV